MKTKTELLLSKIIRSPEAEQLRLRRIYNIERQIATITSERNDTDSQIKDHSLHISYSQLRILKKLRRAKNRTLKQLKTQLEVLQS